MPVYDFQCEKDGCGVTFEAYVTKIGSKAPCPACKTKKVEKLWSVRSGNAANGFPYVTTHITGAPLEIKSEAHLKEVCKAHGVTHRPDSAFLTKEYAGYNWKTGKQEYREGSGVGMPGSWV